VNSVLGEEIANTIQPLILVFFSPSCCIYIMISTIVMD